MATKRTIVSWLEIEGLETAGGAVHYTLTAQTGAFALTGIDAVTRSDRRLIAVTGAFTLTGYAAALSKTGAFVLLANTGVFTLTGINATLLAVHAYKLTVSTGVFTLTGINAVTRKSFVLTALPGSFTLTGIAANLTATIVQRLTAQTRAFLLTGYSANLVYVPILHYTMAAATGSFVLSGQFASLKIFRMPRREILQFGRPVYHVPGRW
jgi:hypothetical protein